MSINFIFKLQKLINNIEELAQKVQFWQKDLKISTKIPNKHIKRYKYKKLLRAVQKIDKTLTSILEIT